MMLSGMSTTILPDWCRGCDDGDRHMVPTVKSTGGKKAKPYCSKCWVPFLPSLTAMERGEDLLSHALVPVMQVQTPFQVVPPPPPNEASTVEFRRPRCRRAAFTLSACKQEAVVMCDSCRQWCKARDFGCHACCKEASAVVMDRLLCFAASQITSNDTAWEVFAMHNKIPDYVIADAPGDMRPKLRMLQRRHV